MSVEFKPVFPQLPAFRGSVCKRLHLVCARVTQPGKLINGGVTMTSPTLSPSVLYTKSDICHGCTWRNLRGSETNGTSRQSVAGALLLRLGLDKLDQGIRLDQRTHPEHALAAAGSYRWVSLPKPRRRGLDKRTGPSVATSSTSGNTSVSASSTRG
jgi:hypothetical protein